MIANALSIPNVAMIGAVSSEPTITLSFSVQPGNSTTGVPLPQQPQVTAMLNAAPDTDFEGDVTVALIGSGTLTGTTTVTAVAGVAVFTNLAVTTTGGAFTLSASSPDTVSAESDPFDIAP